MNENPKFDSPLMSHSEWDSFKHIDFLMKIEGELNIEFEPEDQTTTLKEIIQLANIKCSLKN